MTNATIPKILKEVSTSMDTLAARVYDAAKAREIGRGDYWTDFDAWDGQSGQLPADPERAREYLEARARDFVAGIATARMHLNDGNLDSAMSGIQALLVTAEGYKDAGIKFPLPSVTSHLIRDAYNAILAKAAQLKTSGLHKRADNFASKADILRADAHTHGYRFST